jgi:hypothetical protein
MKLTFTPAPGSPYRVISADDPQPEESWADWVADKRIAPAEVPAPSGDCRCPTAEDPASTRLPAPLAPASPLPSSAPEPPSAPVPDVPGPLAPLCCPACPDRPQFIQARQQAGFYRALFDAAKKRELTHKARIALLEAEVRLLKQRLFGTKSESRHSPDHLSGSSAADPLAEDAPSAPEASSASTTSTTPPRRRGQQPGQKIPDRRDYSHLPLITEERVLAPQQSCCSCCGMPFAPFGFEEDTFIIEVEVKAYRRRIRRRRYRRVCSCQS